jgi:hypothetical protein
MQPQLDRDATPADVRGAVEQARYLIEWMGGRFK